MSKKTPNVNFMLNYYKHEYKKKSIKRNEPTTLLKMQKIILVTFQLGIEDIKKLDYVKYLSNIKKVKRCV